MQDQPTASVWRRLTGLPLHYQIGIALVLSVLVAALADGTDTTVFSIPLVTILDFFGGLFLNALQMIVVPLIVASIIIGVCNMAGRDSFGRVGAKTIAVYLLTGLLALTTGLILVNVIGPGTSEAARSLLNGLPDASMVMDKVQDKGPGDLANVISRAIPANIFAAAAQTELLALIFISVVFGYFMARTRGPTGETLQSFWTGVHDVMVLITLWVMRFAPLGVFALVTKTFLLSGLGSVGPLLWFFVTVVAALAAHLFITLPLLLRFVAGVRPFAYYAKVLPAQLMAFSTASSSATLPVSLSSAEKAGVSERTTSFVLPLGATVNMDGTALYECVVVIFIAQIYGLELGVAGQLTVLTLALLTSIGVAGIPSASLVAIALILPAVGLPVEALALVLVVDRVLDMCRTCVNVTSDLTVTALIARGESEELPDIRVRQGVPGAPSDSLAQ